jgi:hypothetical protein
MGKRFLFVVTKDVDSVLQRHPRKVLAKMPQMGPSPFTIPNDYAPVDEIAAQIRRFSDVPIREDE